VKAILSVRERETISVSRYVGFGTEPILDLLGKDSSTFPFDPSIRYFSKIGSTHARWRCNVMSRFVT